MFNLNGNVGIVTGASSGLGLGIANVLAEAGARVYAVSRTGGLKDPSAACHASIVHVKADICDTEQMERLVREIGDSQGLDFLVNNAGITADKLILRMEESDWDRVLDINLKGCFNMIKHVTPYMMRKRYGRIVSISSVVGMMGNAGQANYAASKAGIIGLTKTVAKEFGPRNITANAVAPGFIKTAMTDALTEEQKQAMYKQIPLGCLGETQDIANAVKFLVSDDARYITGVVLKVDGGMYI